MPKITKRLIQYSSELSGRHYVSMVLRYCFPADALYMPSHVVDHRSDTPIESFYMPSHVVDHRSDTPIESFVVHFRYVE
jgi:hypothetical protein